MISKTSRKIIFSLVAIVYLLLSFGFVYAGHEPGHAAIINGGGADPIIEQQADCNTDQGQADPNLCYTFVAPFIVADDGSGNKTLIKSVSASFTLGDYINRVIIVITGLAGVAAVIFLIVAGLQYITTENLGQKGQAKQRIQDALVGLLLVLAIGVILRTINPNLLNLNPDISSVNITVTREDGSKFDAVFSVAQEPNLHCPGKSSPQPNDTCVNLDPSVQIKSGANKMASIHIAPKIKSLVSAISSPVYITEAWNKTRNHKAQCHSIGTCVDINFIPTHSPTAEDIEEFINKAAGLGLCAEYEVLGADRYNELKAKLVDTGKVPRSKILNFTNWITASHFSLYDADCR